VACYLGWIFPYVTDLAAVTIESNRQLGYRADSLERHLRAPHREPVLSLAGFGEFGLFSAVAGVPLLAWACLSASRRAVVQAALFAPAQSDLPGALVARERPVQPRSAAVDLPRRLRRVLGVVVVAEPRDRRPGRARPRCAPAVVDDVGKAPSAGSG
jgi:hypothetical protein